jgi:excisionase family DNA binding protein
MKPIKSLARDPDEGAHENSPLAPDRPRSTGWSPSTARADGAGPPPDEALWTVRDVARYLKASPSWVYRSAAAGELPSVHIGGLLRFIPRVICSFASDGGPSQGRRGRR